MAMIFNHNFPRKGYNKGELVKYVTFNAIRDHETMGDQRKNFVTVRKHGEEEFKKVIEACTGDKFTLRIFFENNTDPSMGEKGAAKDTTIRFTSGVFFSFEDEWENVHGNGFMAYISSSNAEPHTVQDFCVVDMSDYARYEYIEGSGRITTKAGTKPFPDRANLIGIEELDGIIPAGESGYVEYDFEVVRR